MHLLDTCLILWCLTDLRYTKWVNIFSVAFIGQLSEFVYFLDEILMFVFVAFEIFFGQITEFKVIFVGYCLPLLTNYLHNMKLLDIGILSSNLFPIVLHKEHVRSKWFLRQVQFFRKTRCELLQFLVKTSLVQFCKTFVVGFDLFGGELPLMCNFLYDLSDSQRFKWGPDDLLSTIITKQHISGHRILDW